MNQINISGRLGGTPELKQTTSGHNVATMSIAVHNGKDRDPIWVPVVAFNKVAEFVANYFQKGDAIEVAGKLRVNQFTKADGSVTRSLEVEARDVSFPPSSRSKDGAGATNTPKTMQGYHLEERSYTGQNNAQQRYATPSDQYAGFMDAGDENLPF